MGVDYTAFAGWGVPVKGVHVEEIEERNGLLKKHGIGYAQFGSAYSGREGILITVNGRYVSAEGGSAKARPLPADRDWDQVDGVARLQAFRDEMRTSGIAIEFDGEPGWYVAGHIW